MQVSISDWPDWPRSGDRTVEIEVTDSDVFSMDSTLAYIIHAMLLKLKEKKHRIPFVYNDDVPEDLLCQEDWWLGSMSNNTTKEELQRMEKAVQKKWDYVLDEMIFSAQAINEHEYDFDQDREDRIDNGFRLFGKYYRSLWY